MDHILKQLSNCDAFFSSQRRLVSTGTLNASMVSMAESIAAQIKVLPGLDVGAAAELNDAITKSTTFGLEQKQLMANAVNDKCMDVAVTTTPQRRGTQQIRDARNYFTEGDWNVLNNQSIASIQKVAVCCDRLSLAGLRNPSEASVRSIVAIIACAHCPTAQPPMLHGLVLDVKSQLQSRLQTKLPTHLHVQNFPDDPKHLPDELRASAYSQESPVMKDVSGYNAMIAKIPLRATNRSLDSQSTRGQTPIQSMPQLNVVAQLLQQMMGLQCQAGGTAGGLSNLILHDRPLPALPAPSSSESTAAAAPQLASAQGASSSTVLAIADAPPKEASAHDDMDLGGDACNEQELASFVDIAGGANGKEIPKMHEIQKKTSASTKKTATTNTSAKKTGKQAGKAKAACMKAAVKPKGKTGLLLGCSKCRGSHKGCGVCRDPNFQGRRFQK